MTQETVKIVGVVVVGILAAIMIIFEIADNLRQEREKDRAREAELEAQGIDPHTLKGDPLLTRIKEVRGITPRGVWRWVQEHSEKRETPEIPAPPQRKR